LFRPALSQFAGAAQDQWQSNALNGARPNDAHAARFGDWRSPPAPSNVLPTPTVLASNDQAPGKILAAPKSATTFGGILGALFGSNTNHAWTSGSPSTLGPAVVSEYLSPEFRRSPPARDGGAATSASPHIPIVAKRSEGPLAPPPLAPPPVAPPPTVPPPPVPLPLWQRIAAAPVGLTGALATAILLGSTIRTAKREDDEFHPQYVIRGGISAPGSLQDNTANLAPLRMPNEYGMSSSTAPPPMGPEDILAVPKYPGNRQYSYTILPELNALGYRLEPTPTRDNPLHSSILLAPGETQLTEAQAQALSAIFRRRPNPYFDPSYPRPR
jgi:hypothetical protein